MAKTKSVKDLQKQWYAKLEKEGFSDIENTDNPNRPLIEWHSFKLPSEKFQIMQANRAEYQKNIEDFSNHPSFPDICETMVKHGNCKFESWEINLVWAYHIDGLTTREIAKKFGKVKSRIDDILKGLREWMRLI